MYSFQEIVASFLIPWPFLFNFESTTKYAVVHSTVFCTLWRLLHFSFFFPPSSASQKPSTVWSRLLQRRWKSHYFIQGGPVKVSRSQSLFVCVPLIFVLLNTCLTLAQGYSRNAKSSLTMEHRSEQRSWGSFTFILKYPAALCWFWLLSWPLYFWLSGVSITFLKSV